MTRYLIKAGKAVRDFYNDMNGANLTGAIDVIVVRQKDRSLVGTPIHAHFGKLGVLRSREKEVELCVNGEVIDFLDIRLNEWGTATIYENNGNISSYEESLEYKRNIQADFINNEDFCNAFEYKENIVEKNLDEFALHSNEGIFQLEDVYPESPSEIYRDARTPSIVSFQSTTSSFGGRRHSFSESELFESTDEELLSENIWVWNRKTDENFEFTGISTDISTLSKEDENAVLFPSNNDGILERMKRLLLRPSSTPSSPIPMSVSPDPPSIMNHTPVPPEMSIVPPVSKPVDISSDLGSSPETSHTVSPSSSPPLRNPFGIFSNCNTPVAMSLCGGLNFEKDIEQQIFEKHLVTFEKFASFPEILSDPNLVVSINGKYYNWRVAAPILMSRICFNEPLPTENIAKLSEGNKQSRLRSWFTWSKKSDSINDKEQKSFSTELPHPIENPIDNISGALEQIEPLQPLKHESELIHDNGTNVLTSEQLASLPLKEGPNEVSLSVATRYQGTCRVDCTLYLWNYNDKIVVSDIDGTITKSDALGQILPILGKDWSHKGVTDLYSKIEANGYKFIYLSARAIGQSTPTRTMLQNIRQRNITLPDGPLLLAPLSLFGAFHQEVIAKKPDVFKIRCLEEVKGTFPSVSNPFFAGYGNRQTDVKSYEAIGIPKSRIFIINTKGQLRHQQALSFRSSYTSLTEYVDFVYPFLGEKHLDNKFSDFLYWNQNEYGSDLCDEYLKDLEDNA